MNTKKLTEASLLSALYVVISIVAISTGFAYSIYLDLIVPVFICLIYMRLGIKYTLLSSITSMLIVILAIGDFVSGIWMSQGIVIGLISGYLIIRDSSIFDDLLLGSIGGCFVMILVDVYLATFTGYSFMKEFQGYASLFPTNKGVLDIIYYVFVATIPMGTILVVYLSSLILGNKMNVLNIHSYKKYKIIMNFKKYGSYVCCSSTVFLNSLVYLIVIEALNRYSINIKSIYINTVAMSSRIIVLYFVLKDSFAFVSKYLYIKLKSYNIVQIFSFGVLFFMMTSFYKTCILIIVASIVINTETKLRQKQFKILNDNLNLNLIK